MMSQRLNFEVESDLNQRFDLNQRLLNSEHVLVKQIRFNPLHVFSRCEKNENGQSWLGIFLYVFTVCGSYLIGYSIYRAQDIEQSKLSNVELFGDVSMVAFFAFVIINLSWHGFEKLTCLGDESRCLGVVRYLCFVGSMLVSTVVYGTIRNIPFFQTSLNSDLTGEQWWFYFAAFAVVFCIVVYWCVKLFDLKCTRRCCRPSYVNRLVFVRLLIAIVTVNVLSYFVCKSDEECVYHLHHFHFGLCLVFLSTPLMNNWFDMILQGTFFMFVLESQWNYRVTVDAFFI